MVFNNGVTALYKHAPCQKYKRHSEYGFVFVTCIDFKTHAEEKKWIISVY